ncbi:MAG: hypothetical protein R6X32_17380 [Chloroflexota bacterium]
MSDYLSNLVARTLESAPVLQPRQPSLFEPVGGGWGMVHRDWGMEIAGETAVSPPNLPQPTMPPQPQPIVANPGPPVQPASPAAKAAAPPTAVWHHQPIAPLVRQEPPARSHQPAEKPETIRHTTVNEKMLVQQRIEPKVTVRPAAASDKPAQPARRSRSEAAVSDPAAAVKPVTAPPPVPQPTRPVAPAAIPATTTPPIRTMPVVVEKRPLTRSAAKTTGQEPTPPAAIPAPKATRANKQSAAPAQTALQQITPAVALNDLRPSVSPPRPIRPRGQEQRATSREETAVPAPTIQVHIGRIEVRATPPPPSPKKSRPQPSLTSLDDYLRQRNGGGR